MTLYEPAFNLLTRRFAGHYREAITALTLVGGFASTLAFPAVAWLIAVLEWRGALQAIGLALLPGIAPLHAWHCAAAATLRRPAHRTTAYRQKRVPTRPCMRRCASAASGR